MMVFEVAVNGTMLVEATDQDSAIAEVLDMLYEHLTTAEATVVS